MTNGGGTVEAAKAEAVSSALRVHVPNSRVILSHSPMKVCLGWGVELPYFQLRLFFRTKHFPFVVSPLPSGLVVTLQAFSRATLSRPLLRRTSRRQIRWDGSFQRHVVLPASKPSGTLRTETCCAAPVLPGWLSLLQA